MESKSPESQRFGLRGRISEEKLCDVLCLGSAQLQPFQAVVAVADDLPGG